MQSLALISTGGTIAMPRAGGRPELGGDELVAQLAERAGLPEIVHYAPLSCPSPDLSLDAIALIAATANRAVESGARGVVVCHGTDTLEETAFALSLMYRSAVPLVLTGAMRPAQAAGSDGPANLLAALRVAADSRAAGLSWLVVMNDQIHAAALVSKVRGFGADGFSSDPFGPIGLVIEGRARIGLAPRRQLPSLGFRRSPGAIPILLAGAGLEPGVVDLVASDGIAGLVVAGAGGGHVSAAAAFSLGAASARLPVVLAARAAGGTLASSYGYVGGDIDLLSRGLISAGPLTAPKARVALALMLSGGAGLAEIRAGFEELGRCWE